MDDELARRVEEAVSKAWRTDDPDVRTLTRRHSDGKLDVTVVTRLFESEPCEDRERMLWSVLRSFPPSDTVQMTYSLLLTPSEASDFAADLPAAAEDPDDVPGARKDPL
jgi:hypothetical protein